MVDADDMPTYRLPTPGGDDDAWGDILNDYLRVGHNADGTHPDATVSTKGQIQLAGDLGGTADAPTVVAASQTTAGIAKLGATGGAAAYDDPRLDKIVVLGPVDPVPTGLAPGTVIIRTSS